MYRAHPIHPDSRRSRHSQLGMVRAFCSRPDIEIELPYDLLRPVVDIEKRL